MRFWVACTVDFLRFFACLLLLASVLHDASSVGARGRGGHWALSVKTGWLGRSKIRFVCKLPRVKP
jgi:hypothetical protein